MISRLIAQVKITTNRMFPLYLNNIIQTCFIAKLKDLAWIWHFRYGHLNFNGLKMLQHRKTCLQVFHISQIPQIFVKIVQLASNTECHSQKEK